jgi:Holliday junction resolvase RusA-like endonuclease
MSNFILENYKASIIKETKKVSFIVRGTPPSQFRPRVNWKKRSTTVVYDASSQQKKNWKEAATMALANYSITLFPIIPSLNGIKVMVAFYFVRPKYHISIKTGCVKDTAPFFPSSKDIDNLIKFIFDAMQGIFFNNDSAIVEINATKNYVMDNIGYTSITLMEL